MKYRAKATNRVPVGGTALAILSAGRPEEMAMRMQQLHRRVDKVCRRANRRVFRLAIEAPDAQQARRLAFAALVYLAAKRPKKRPLLGHDQDNMSNACQALRRLLGCIGLEVEP